MCLLSGSRLTSSLQPAAVLQFNTGRRQLEGDRRKRSRGWKKRGLVDEEGGRRTMEGANEMREERRKAGVKGR